MGPRRPLPRSVYVRRRIVVVVIAIVVIGLLIWAFAPKGGTPTAAATNETPGTDSTGGATASGPGDSATGADGPECDPSRIAITANTDKTEYQAGEAVQMTLTLTNNSSADCIIAAGTDQQSFIITSPSADGDETYWTSTDCQTDAQPQNVTLKPGIPVPTPALAWDRHRSIAGDCDPAVIEARPVVGGGGASFDLTVKLGDLTSTKHRFYLY